MERAFEVKQKTFFQVSQLLSLRLEKQTSKNVADTTFESNCIFLAWKFQKIKQISQRDFQRIFFPLR